MLTYDLDDTINELFENKELPIAPSEEDAETYFPQNYTIIGASVSVNRSCGDRVTDVEIDYDVCPPCFLKFNFSGPTDGKDMSMRNAKSIQSLNRTEPELIHAALTVAHTFLSNDKDFEDFKFEEITKNFKEEEKTNEKL